MRILVCDDREMNCHNLVETIRGAIGNEDTVEELTSSRLEEALKALFSNIKGFLQPSPHSSPVESPFDNQDLIVLDNNLTHLNLTGSRLTAESIAGYIRAFSTGTYIISLNKNPDVDFDLRFLIGDYSTQTDLALNQNHLGNRALWTGRPSDSDDGFIPWYWPRLRDVVKRRKEQIAFVQARLEAKVFSSLLFHDDAIDFLSYHAKGALSSDAGADLGDEQSMRDVTFSDVFLKADSLPIPADRKSLHQTRENPGVSQIIVRAVAAYIDRWFRRDVLGPQEALVDLPHLLMRLPFLLGERANDSAQWNNAVLEDEPPYGIDVTLYNSCLAATEFTGKMWSPGPCFWWPRLKNDDTLSEHFQAADGNLWADVVFCEDRSQFVPRRREQGGETPVEFSTEFEGSWRSRYVLPIDSRRYSPRSRLMHDR